MPTCVAAAGGAVDPAWKLDGVNLLPYLSGENTARPHQTLYWRIDGMWAIRHGDWKLVHGQAGDDPPELFDLAADVGEQHDLASEQPAKVQELQSLWDAWNAEQAPPVKSKAKAGKKAKRPRASERMPLAKRSRALMHGSRLAARLCWSDFQRFVSCAKADVVFVPREAACFMICRCLVRRACFVLLLLTPGSVSTRGAIAAEPLFETVCVFEVTPKNKPNYRIPAILKAPTATC